jgi:SAM-dependent methyltransferase
MEGIRHLDAGCGAGMAAKLAADRGARVFGLDASENLLAVARTRVPDGEFRAGDLEAFPYADDAFDLVTGFNSFQFAARPTVAFAEARRVTKPGGVVAIMTWGKPEGMEWASILGALRSVTPPPPPGTPGPFVLSDENALRDLAESVGLHPKEVFDVEGVQRYPDLDIALQGLMSSGNAARAVEQSSEDAVRRAYADALARFRQTDGSYKIGTRFRCMLARK